MTRPPPAPPRAAAGLSRLRPAALAVLGILLVSACSASGRTEVLVSAASSLSDAFGEIEAAFEVEHPEVDIVLNLGGSSSLREQIMEGAPADVFASADGSTMDAIVAAGMAQNPVTFASNRIQLAVPAGNPASIAGLSDLARQDLTVGLCDRSVPCGTLARLVLADAGVTASPDTEEPNVRSLLLKLAAGDLDVGMVYASDVLSTDGEVEGVGLPIDPPAEYPIAVLSNAPHPTVAADFVAFVLSDEGRSMLQSHGFATP